MEALAAVGLASSVIQFVDFTSQLLSKGQEFYRSVDGTLVENVEFVAIAEHFRSLKEDLTESTVALADARQPSPAEEDLQRVAARCEQVALTFLTLLNGLKITGHPQKWKSFRQALKTMWSKDEIEEMLQKLRLLREELAVHLLIVISQWQTSNMRTVLDSQKQMEINIIHAVQQSRSKVEAQVDQLSADLNNLSTSLNNLSPGERQEKRQETISTWQIANKEDLIQLLNNLSKLESDKTRKRVAHLMMHSLYFPQIQERHSRIALAHAETFDWIFGDSHQRDVPEANFVDWLEDRQGHDGLYWNDKTSGKVIRIEKINACELFLLEYRLVNAEVANRTTTVVALRAPNAMLRMYRNNFTLALATNPELLSALHNLVKGVKGFANICFFVDRLDEFEGDDKARTEVIDLFCNISKSTNIKVCLSSRPWLIFEDAFQNHSSLLLQQLTYNDITKYVQIELENNSRFQRLRGRENVACKRLIENIV
ncbi:hypothetical protein MMC17_007878 [Xylographa soralifera]|nr:hypothetical protein [Xylographa soralifera]